MEFRDASGSSTLAFSSSTEKVLEDPELTLSAKNPVESLPTRVNALTIAMR